jgi:hypothetical protein
MFRRIIEQTQALVLVALITLCSLIIGWTTSFATATTNTSTNTQLKTYTDPGGFFTLQYPADWTVEYKQPVTKFDNPRVIFKSYQPASIVSVSVQPTTMTPDEFRSIYSSMAYRIANDEPGMTIDGEGFGIYSIAGYDTYAYEYDDSNIQDPTNPHKGLHLFSLIGYHKMSLLFLSDPESFDKQMPAVQKMIDSIKIIGIR